MERGPDYQVGDAVAIEVVHHHSARLDLGEEWLRLTGLPFVFAFWACLSDPGLRQDLAAVFQEGKEWGLARREEVADEYRCLIPPEGVGGSNPPAQIGVIDDIVVE